MSHHYEQNIIHWIYATYDMNTNASRDSKAFEMPYMPNNYTELYNKLNVDSYRPFSYAFDKACWDYVRQS